VTSLVPGSHEDLLERPLFAHVATMRPDGRIQANPMWYAWDGRYLRLTTSTARQKFRNVRADPRLTLSVHDPERPYRYLELRGEVVAVEPDPEGEFFDSLAERYGLRLAELADRPLRVVLVVEPAQCSYQ
jgi:PPOX class probable F420-dependent enzyme